MLKCFTVLCSRYEGPPIYIHTHTHTHIHTYTHTHIYIYICICIYIYIYILYMCMYMYIYQILVELRITKIAPPNAIIFLDSLEEDILNNSLFKPLVWWRYNDDIFMMWKHGGEELQQFLETLNFYHSIVKFTGD